MNRPLTDEEFFNNGLDLDGDIYDDNFVILTEENVEVIDNG